MAQIETWYNQDLQQAVKVRYIDGNVFSADNAGNIIGVNVFDGGEPATLSGSVSGLVIRADGSTVAIVGTLSGNQVSVALPQSAYAVPGAISVVVKLTDGETVTTLLAVVGVVYMSTTDTVVDPGTIIPDITTLVAEIEAAVASIPADYSDLWTSLAPNYSTSSTYAVGQYVTYNGGLYRCVTAITSAESWTAAHWTAAKLGPDISDLKSALETNGAGIELNGSATGSRLGVAFARSGNTIYAHGSSGATGVIFFNVLDAILPYQGIKAGDTVYFNAESYDSDKLYGQVMLYRTSDLSNYYESFTINGTLKKVTLADDCGKILIRLRTPNSKSIDGNISILVEKFPLESAFIPSDEWEQAVRCFGGLGEDGATYNLNTHTENGFFLMHNAVTYINGPSGVNTGFFRSVYSGNWRLQLIYAFTGNNIYKRRGNTDGSTWEAWQTINGGSVNNYTFNEYSETVTLNASPTITSDTNNYLPPSGDTSDRTSAILAMLTSNGICRLGAGNYYIKDLQMPDGSSIIGSGYATKIYLIGSSDGYAIKMGSNCAVKDLALFGAESESGFSVPALYIDNQYGEGGRHGIIWQGTYTGNSSLDQDATAPIRGTIDNVHIQWFTGGGIRCYNTGVGTENCIEATNVYILRCWAGLDIIRYSEFHKFTNIKTEFCRVGCLNNGGNNVFVNCDFSHSLEIAMYMDNSNDQSPNNTHGSCVGCVFNHTILNGQSNKGTGIKILNCASGFMFTGCQIFYSQIDIEDTDGIVIAGTNFGYNNCDVTISGGGAIIFANCMVEGAIPVSITNNSNVHFVNCYNKLTGATWGT